MRRSLPIICLLAFGAIACKREARDFQRPTAENAPAQDVQLSELHPGAPSPAPRFSNPYEENAYAVSEGKRLFGAYNCSGCHANGGGGIGPPLIDADWIYGGDSGQIYDTIVKGRPNGMPSFSGKIPEFQVWELVAYVRSLSGQLPIDVANSRSDHMQGKKPEALTPKEHPRTEYPASMTPENH
jgi:cytochrome c oxidase cbb3-type subunit 3